MGSGNQPWFADLTIMKERLAKVLLAAKGVC